ncbi:MAG: prepilin-type N-terminal cleavage/methylation domain-containing protein [Planctomycetes bacterium RBG_16_64_12]|nr:MAG: prepilin-type N-terminal cleavage/methylation domain-containing protein [Planctomycetes bacterium RBG_16_64_12]
MVVLAVMGVLLSLSAPSFRRSTQQSRADVAGANLRAIWAAERLYWLEYRAYTNDLSLLESLGLVDPTVVAATTPYTYSIPSGDASTFTAAATRAGSARWWGQFTIDQDGLVSGTVQATGQPDIVPGFL